MTARTGSRALYAAGVRWNEAAQWAVFCRGAAALLAECGQDAAARRMRKRARDFARNARLACGGVR